MYISVIISHINIFNDNNSCMNFTGETKVLVFFQKFGNRIGQRSLWS